MATFFLIRHALAEGTGVVLAGRRPQMHLTREGHNQAAQLAAWLARRKPQHLLSSPLERTRETAEHISRSSSLPVEIADSLTEINFGDWTGCRVNELEPMAHWKRWNLFRSGVRIPNGEMLSEVQTRMVREIERLTTAFPGDRLALVSHADPIKAAIIHYLGIPIDLMERLEISPASVTILEINDWSARALAINWRVDEAEF